MALDASPHLHNWREQMAYKNPVQGKLREGSRYVRTKTADYTIPAAEAYGSVFNTDGAGGAVVFNLPAALPGMNLEFRVGAAQELRINPSGTETIALPSTGVQGAAGKYLTADANGETIKIACDKTGQWSVLGFTGTWAAEA